MPRFDELTSNGQPGAPAAAAPLPAPVAPAAGALDFNGTINPLTGQKWKYGPNSSPGIEERRQARIQGGMGQISDIFSQYDDGFFDKRKQDYLSFATPQVMDQYRTTKNNLAYTLARNGLLGSSAGIRENSSLDKNLALQEGNLANTAQGQANNLRGQVQDARNSLTSQLIASSDPATVASGAAAATANLKAPGAFQPLSNLFNDWTSIYTANQNAKAYDPQTANLFSSLGGAR
jgi:hypothetical protein